MTTSPGQDFAEQNDNDVWPPHHIDAVLDALASLAEHVVTWSANAWEAVSAVAATDHADRTRARDLAHQVAERLDRTRLVTFAHETVAAGPQPHHTGALQALRDALTAMLLADALPEHAHHLLMQPIATASDWARQAADSLATDVDP